MLEGLAPWGGRRQRVAGVAEVGEVRFVGCQRRREHGVPVAGPGRQDGGRYLAPVVLQIPVASKMVVSGQVVGRRDVGACRAGQHVHERLAGLARGEVAAIDQQVAACCQ